jgi:hypothetical protein
MIGLIEKIKEMITPANDDMAGRKLFQLLFQGNKIFGGHPPCYTLSRQEQGISAIEFLNGVLPFFVYLFYIAGITRPVGNKGHPVSFYIGSKRRLPVPIFPCITL